MGAEVIIVPGAFLMVSWIIWVIVDGLRRASQTRHAAQFQGRLLERLGSAHEFSEFLATDAGAKLLASQTVDSGRSPHGRILTAVQSGLVLLVLGVAIFIFVQRVPLGDEAPESLAFAATVATAIGIGLLLSSLASYLLSRRMGLLNGDRGRSGAA
jgi:hypothetical protein